MTAHPAHKTIIADIAKTAVIVSSITSSAKKALFLKNKNINIYKLLAVLSKRNKTYVMPLHYKFI